MTQIDSRRSAAHRAPRVPGLTILFHPESERIGDRTVLLEVAEGDDALLSRREPQWSAPGSGLRRPLDHPSLSRTPIRIRQRSGDGALQLDVTETRTRVEVGGGPVVGTRELTPDEVERGVVLRLGPHIVALLHRLDPVSPSAVGRHGLIGESAGLVQVRRQIHKVADLDVSVLIRGETGSGKELVARAIHDAGRRRKRPFVAVNMAALPTTLAASELFGVTKGAFTGADRLRRGLFQQADGGTLFLDEIGETPPEVQALLLRALETREIRPVGSEEVHRVDVRLISATDANLEAEIGAERFRAPLLHRLAGFEIPVPALRERRDDFGRLLLPFLREELTAVGEEHVLLRSEISSWLPAEIVARLANYDWPGNVRQLRNIVRQIVITSRGEDCAHLPESVETLLATPAMGTDTSSGVRPKSTQPGIDPAAESDEHSSSPRPAEIDDDALVELLRTHRFNVRAAAASAEISPTSLYALIEKSLRLRKPSEIEREEIEACLQRADGDADAAALDLEVSSLGLKRRMKELGLR